MTAKVRVEDLAAELQLSNKEIIQQLREIGVQAKSQKTIVEDEDVDRFKAELKQGGGKRKVVRRVGESGVIIRRTRKKTRESADEEAVSTIDETVDDSSKAEAEAVAQAPVEKAVEEIGRASCRERV